jgi:hypothetical protein
MAQLRLPKKPLVLYIGAGGNALNPLPVRHIAGLLNLRDLIMLYISGTDRHDVKCGNSRS